MELESSELHIFNRSTLQSGHSGYGYDCPEFGANFLCVFEKPPTMLDDDEQNIFLVKISPSFWTSKLSLAGRKK